MRNQSSLTSPELAAEVPTPQNLQERLELANKLYREYRLQCFWQSPRDLVITEDRIPFVMMGLRANGGRRGFVLAGKLRAPQPDRPASEEEPR
jgi:hypothetical protein